MRSGLEEIAAAADDVADKQRLVARRARMMQRQRDRGWSWRRIFDREGHPELFELLRHSRRLLGETTGRFAHLVASGLRTEGESTRRVAQRLGVSHQRISTILQAQRPPAE